MSVPATAVLKAYFSEQKYLGVCVITRENWPRDHKNKGPFQNVSNSQKEYFIIRIKT